MKKPDEQVSEQIVVIFQKQKLLQDDTLKGLAEKLASGKVTSDEWKVLFKLDITQSKKKDGQDQA